MPATTKNIKLICKIIFIESSSKPARGPLFIASLKPFSTEGMYSFGIFPPVTLFSNLNPSPGLVASKVISTLAN